MKNYKAVSLILTSAVVLSACEKVPEGIVEKNQDYLLFTTIADNDASDSNYLNILTALEYQRLSSDGTIDGEMTGRLTPDTDFMINTDIIRLNDELFNDWDANQLYFDAILQVAKPGYTIDFTSGKSATLKATEPNKGKSLTQLFPVENQQHTFELAFMQAPMLSDSLKAKVGASITDDRGTWTVNKVTDTTIIGQLTNTQPKLPLLDIYGEFELDRKTGWLNYLAVMQQVKTETSTLSYRTLLAQKDQKNDAVISFMEDGGQIYDLVDTYNKLIKYKPLNGQLSYDATKLHSTATQLESDINGFQNLISKQDGRFTLSDKWSTSSNGIINLHLFIPTVGHHFGLKATYDNIEFFDHNDQLVDLNLWQDTSAKTSIDLGWASSLLYNEQPFETSIKLAPTGLTGIQEKLDTVDHAKATITLTPATQKEVTVKWQDVLNKSYAFGDSSLTVTPIDTQTHQYAITLHNPQGASIKSSQSLAFDVNQLVGKLKEQSTETNFDSAKVYPDWVTPADRQALQTLSQPNGTQRFEVTLESEPKALTFIQLESQPQLAYSRVIDFVDTKEYAQNINNPIPSGQALLKASIFMLDYPKVELMDRYEARDITFANLDAFKFDMAENNRIIITMQNTMMTRSCQPQLHPELKKQYGTDWVLQPSGNSYAPAPINVLTLPKADDPSQGQAVEGRIHCTGNIKWINLPLINTPLPWMVDITALLENRKLAGDEEGFLNQPASALFDYLSIKDEDDLSLDVRKVSDDDNALVKDLLIDGHLLSLDGIPAEAKYSTITNEPIDIPYAFMVTFK